MQGFGGLIIAGGLNFAIAYGGLPALPLHSDSSVLLGKNPCRFIELLVRHLHLCLHLCTAASMHPGLLWPNDP